MQPNLKMPTNKGNKRKSNLKETKIIIEWNL